MNEEEMDDVLRTAHELAAAYLRGLRDRPVGAREDATAIAKKLRGNGLAESGEKPAAVVHALAEAVEPGLIASAGPRYFGFVFGGALPASVGADWLTSAWDQNAVLHAGSPAGTAAEQVAGEWMLDLLGLPANSSFGLPTGAGLGNAVGVAAARHAVLARAGWDVERKGLFGAPEIEVVIGDEGHASLLTALQYLGLGRERVTRVPTDEQGRIQAESLRRMLPKDGRPTIVCAQAGNVNTGAFDPLDEMADAVAGLTNGWLHIDGAFGLWAAASPRFAHLVQGVERADSWATDAHKWLNVNYDCGFVAVRDPQSHHAAMSGSGAYLQRTEAQREGWDWVLDSSRRARGFALYAALRSLGRQGVRELVERCCDLATRMASKLAEKPDFEVLNDVVLNQVLVRVMPAGGGDPDEFTRELVRRIQSDGTAWMGGTTWHGKAAIRISVSNWMTTEADADATVEAIVRAAAA
jgi:glutamate/tyrosine decarboxylase-like PLP-dependent enzyme